MSIYESVIALVGDVPAGFDIIAWVFSAIVLIYLVRTVFSIIATILNWVGGQ